MAPSAPARPRLTLKGVERKRPGPAPKPLSEKLRAKPLKEVRRVKRKFTRERKIEVLLYLLNHRVADTRERRCPRRRMGQPHEEELTQPIAQGENGNFVWYRAPTYTEASKFWKIPVPTICGWWDSREKILEGTGIELPEVGPGGLSEALAATGALPIPNKNYQLPPAPADETQEAGQAGNSGQDGQQRDEAPAAENGATPTTSGSVSSPNPNQAQTTPSANVTPQVRAPSRRLHPRTQGTFEEPYTRTHDLCPIPDRPVPILLRPKANRQCHMARPNLQTPASLLHPRGRARWRRSQATRHRLGSDHYGVSVLTLPNPSPTNRKHHKALLNGRHHPNPAPTSGPAATSAPTPRQALLLPRIHNHTLAPTANAAQAKAETKARKSARPKQSAQADSSASAAPNQPSATTPAGSPGPPTNAAGTAGALPDGGSPEQEGEHADASTPEEPGSPSPGAEGVNQDSGGDAGFPSSPSMEEASTPQDESTMETAVAPEDTATLTGEDAQDPMTEPPEEAAGSPEEDMGMETAAAPPEDTATPMDHDAEELGAETPGETAGSPEEEAASAEPPTKYPADATTPMEIDADETVDTLGMGTDDELDSLFRTPGS
ncbi:hypothetical protein C8A01DRAFT_39524 [Parachaetomium inaequale]|uniref:Uncharacterized protein n=1 Tax=Parachaetomium inaequale TaxID=2588326 RepID=A0AAN6P922_9PEZI|nr:hypothetical protein C8A01DRAFT_39524 [Parachaetomium inaequale]